MVDMIHSYCKMWQDWEYVDWYTGVLNIGWVYNRPTYSLTHVTSNSCKTNPFDL
jgi:hypothetical protein